MANLRRMKRSSALGRGMVAICLLACLVVSSAAALAQTATAEPDYPLPISVERCLQMPTGGRDQFPRTGCEALAGVTVRVTTADNQPVGSCRTGSRGTCEVVVKFNSMVIVAEELADVPRRYQPLANPVMTWVYTEFAGAAFSNVRSDLVPASPVAGSVTLTVHSRVCPAGYAGPSYFATCHGTVPQYQQWFFVWHGQRERAAQIGADGNLTFAGLEAGELQIQPALPDATSRVVVFCSQAATPGVEYPSTLRHSPYEPANSYTVLLTARPGAALLCDLFAIPTFEG